MELIKKIQHFFAYWFVRYLLATELYMVQTWERVVVHILYFLLFAAVFYFNYSIVTTGVAQLRNNINYIESIL